MPTNRQRAIQSAKTYWGLKPVFIDTETTGLHGSAEIIEISVVDFEGQKLVDTLIKPRRAVPLEAIQVHGITNQMLLEAPKWEEAWPDIQAVLQGRYIGVYNVDFDLRMLKQSHRLNGLVWTIPEQRFFCVMKLFSQYQSASHWLTLEAAGRRLGIPLPNAHRALQDALLARAVFRVIASGV